MPERRRFQSLQGTIQTILIQLILKHLIFVSIPSRYDPNGSFNFSSHSRTSYVSIPSRYDPNSVTRSRISSAIPVSIPSRYDPNRATARASSGTLDCFNPFKVRSKPVRVSARGRPPEEFQSLQGTIQTGDRNKIKYVPIFVSIPSRYDPNRGNSVGKPLQSSVSIPSRYDPNEKYGKGKFTEKGKSFNPFKVRSKPKLRPSHFIFRHRGTKPFCLTSKNFDSQ